MRALQVALLLSGLLAFTNTLAAAQIRVDMKSGKVTQRQAKPARPANAPAAAKTNTPVASKKMTNHDVIEMGSLGFSDAVIIEKIRSAEATDFDTSVAGLKLLKANNISDAVVRAVINPRSEAAEVASVVRTPNAKMLPEEIGVYLVRKDELVEVEPEVVGTQSGGILKTAATLGMTHGHVNAKVMNPHSTLRVWNPVELVVKTAEGISVTEFQFLRLDERGNRREFRVATGGVFHVSSGSEKNWLSFTPEKVGTRTWRIRLQRLTPGEYGFLPPGVWGEKKLYSFSVIE